MLNSVIARIRQKTREDYEELVFSAITDLRIWVQEHAERAALVFLAVGFLIPFLFKLVLFVAGVVVVLGFAVWTIALPGAPESASPADAEGSNDAPPSFERSEAETSPPQS